MRERGGDLDDDTSSSDFPIKFARDLVAHMPAGKAPRAGARGQGLHRRRSRNEELEQGRDRAARSSASTGPTRRPTRRRSGAAERPRGEGRDRSRRATRSTPASRWTLKVTVKNNGKQPRLPRCARRPRATTRSSTTRSSSSARSSPGQIEDGDHAARLVRGRGPQAGLDSAPVATERAARLPDPEGRAHPQRRHQGEVRRGRRARAAPTPRSAPTVRGARAPGLRVRLPDRRQPRAATATGACSGRARHHVPDRQERRQGPLVRDPGQHRATSRATACSSTTVASTSRT